MKANLLYYLDNFYTKLFYKSSVGSSQLHFRSVNFRKKPLN